MEVAVLRSLASLNPGPWVLAASLFCGAALSSATRRPPARTAEAARAGKWVGFALCMALSVAAWLLAVFVPGPSKIMDSKYPLFYAGASVLFALAFRFRKTIGLLLLLSFVVAGATGFLFSRSLRPHVGAVEVGRLVAYAVREDGMELELRVPGMQTEYLRLSGDRLVPVVTSVDFDDLWPGLGWVGWYRVEGVSSYQSQGTADGGAIRRPSSPFVFERRGGVSESLYALFLRLAPRMPGVKVSRSDDGVFSGGSRSAPAAQPPLEELVEYSVRLMPDGSVQVVELP